MKALREYVTQKNAWRGNRPLNLNNPQDRQEIAQLIECELSPENLYCDGEISHSAAMVKYRKLITMAKQIQKLDPTITFYSL